MGGGAKKSGGQGGTAAASRAPVPGAPAVCKRSRSQRPGSVTATAAAAAAVAAAAGTSLGARVDDVGGGAALEAPLPEPHTAGATGTNLYNVEWSAKEQQVLERGLRDFPPDKFSSLMRYIKIANLLPGKCVRDVALRVRWASRKENGKKRKADEAKGKKGKNGEARPPSVFSMTTPAPGMFSGPVTGRQQPQYGMPPLPPNSKMNQPMHRVKDELYPAGAQHTGQLPMGMYPSTSVPLQIEEHGANTIGGIGGHTGELLQQNINMINRIRHNLDMQQVNENTELFSKLRDNIGSILNGMTNMPGVMSQMPALPVKLNIGLANSVLPQSSMAK